jgi:hypothetical protein
MHADGDAAALYDLLNPWMDGFVSWHVGAWLSFRPAPKLHANGFGVEQDNGVQCGRETPGSWVNS